jgi:hypothetical protein
VFHRDREQFVGVLIARGNPARWGFLRSRRQAQTGECQAHQNLVFQIILLYFFFRLP